MTEERFADEDSRQRRFESDLAHYTNLLQVVALKSSSEIAFTVNRKRNKPEAMNIPIVKGWAFNMRLALFLLVLSISLGSLQKMSIVQVKASPEMFQGDLIIADDNVTIIEGQFDINGSIIVEENATLIIRNASVNFALTYDGQFNMSFRNPSFGKPHLIVENASINSNNHYLTINLFDNSSAELNGLNLGSDLRIPYPYILLYDESHAIMQDSTVTYIPAMDSSELVASNSSIASIGGYDTSGVALTDCKIDSITAADEANFTVTNCTLNADARIQTVDLNYSLTGLAPGLFEYWSFTTDCTVQGATAPNFTVVNTQVGNWSFISQGCSNATISNSETCTLRFLDSSHGQLFNVITGWIISHDNATVDIYDSTTDWIFTYNNSRIWLTNSTHRNYCIIYDESEVSFNWYLDVLIKDSTSQPVDSANVTATYPNATVAESRLTDENGHARLILLGNIRNATGQYFVGFYTINATYETYLNSTTVAICGNQELELVFEDLQIPEYSPVLVLPIFLLIMLIAVTVCKRNSLKSEQPSPARLR